MKVYWIGNVNHYKGFSKDLATKEDGRNIMIRKKALVVGINEYPREFKLRGCVNDANEIAKLLEKNENGSPNFDVKVPTIDKKGMLKHKIKELFQGEGDVALFYFSGHGGRDTTGGCMITPDFDEYDLGVSMNDLETYMSKSKWKNTIAILDCCHAGKMGDFTLAEEISKLKDGMTIMSACNRDEYALECDGHGIFTELLIEGLKGGAADLSGYVTPGSLYAYIDRSLGSWNQRPIFKTNVSSFVYLREVNPQVDTSTLRELTMLFEDPSANIQLDPSFEPTNKPDCEPEIKEPYSDEKNVQKFETLQKLESVGLVVPVGEEHMYFAAMRSGGCKLTPLGKYYWNLVNEGRL